MQRLNGWSGSVIFLCLTSLLVSCGGEPAVDPQGPGSSSSSGSASSSSSSSSGLAVGECQTDVLPVTPLRRLTRFEYENTVRDLLGVDTSVVSDLPADEADGFDNNAALQVAPEFLVEKYALVAEALAAQAIADVEALTGCDHEVLGEQVCAEQFARDFGQRAYRRPLTDRDESQFMAAYEAGARGGNHAEGIEVMVRMALQSPHFLYRFELNPAANLGQNKVPLSDFEMATRLSYFLWGTAPDNALLDAAAAGQLGSKEQVAAKAREMLSSPKARASIENFLAQWSDVRKLETMTKNTALFPNYSTQVRDAMKRELPAFVEYLFASGDLSLANLFTANVAFVSGPLAEIYDVPAPSGGPGDSPQMVTLPEDQGRAGLLTQAGFLAVQGHPDQTSPVLRGKFIRANLLCDPPPPPPDDVDISVPEVTSGTTARDRADIHLAAGGSCAGCHVLMDPIGLAFENFDAMGQYREYENGSAIDVSGEVLYANDPALEGAFTGVKELASKLAESDVVQECVAVQMFRYASGRYETEGDACSLARIQNDFIAADGDLVELMVAMTQSDAFLYRAPEEQQ